ncbi:hypothetical protein V8C86DRAFT_334334 [Haematococcus lacustris]
MARFALLLAAALLVCASAARMTPNEMQDINREGLVGSLMSTSSASSLKALIDSAASMLGRKKDRKESGGPPAFVAIKFIVPPSESEDFEDAWLDLEEDVEKEETPLVFDLKKTKLDNLMYIGYSEWSSMRDLGEHLHSDHFQDFAKFADEHGVRWELELLKDESEDIEDEQNRRGLGVERRRHDDDDSKGEQPEQPEQDQDASDAAIAQLQGKLMKKSNLFHVLVVYIVSPKVREEFMDKWTDMAEEAIKAPGNRIFSLRKVAADNTKFLAYATWDSWMDFHDFVESKTMDKYVDSIADDNVVWFATPLIKIGHQDE